MKATVISSSIVQWYCALDGTTNCVKSSKKSSLILPLDHNRSGMCVCPNQSLEFVTETRILAEMRIENHGTKYFPWGQKSTSIQLFSMKIKMMGL